MLQIISVLNNGCHGRTTQEPRPRYPDAYATRPVRLGAQRPHRPFAGIPADAALTTDYRVSFYQAENGLYAKWRDGAGAFHIQLIGLREEKKSGNLLSRPLNPFIGQEYSDTDLDGWIKWSGTEWRYFTGATID